MALNIFLELSVIFVAAALLGMLAKSLKQPPIIAYILSGILLGPAVLNFLSLHEVIDSFSQIGIAFLLFLVGLSLDSRVFKDVGRVSTLLSIGQIIFTTLIGFGISQVLGFGFIESLYLGIGLALSSTIIIVKLLSDKKDLDSLYGKISVGMLLVQDLLAILLLIFIAPSTGSSTVTGLLFDFGWKMALLGITAFAMHKIFVNKAFEHVGKNQELFFLTGVSLCFVFAVYTQLLGLNAEIGALIAGIILANLPYSQELGYKIRPLRDFFLVLFFVAMGTKLAIAFSPEMIVPAIVLSLFVLIGNPLIVLWIMGQMGYTKKTGFYTGLTFGQVSEFSLILIALGVKVGHLNNTILSLVTMVAIITISISTYFILYNHRLYERFKNILSIFEKHADQESKLHSLKPGKAYDLVIVGGNRMGYSIIKTLGLEFSSPLVVDFDPSVIKKLSAEGIDCMYGDIADLDILEKLQSFKPKVIINTVLSQEDNEMLLKAFKETQPAQDTVIIATARTVHEALEFYKKNAGYVILPQIISGEKVSAVLKQLGKDPKALSELHLTHLRELEHLRGPLH